VRSDDAGRDLRASARDPLVTLRGLPRGKSSVGSEPSRVVGLAAECWHAVLQNQRMTKDWPPPGHSLTYRVDEAFDNVDRISYDMSLPSRASTVNLATVRVGRHGGDALEDLTFREELYQSVGSITVAGGHVEAAMKRLLLLLAEAETTFSLVDYQWYELETKLRAQCDDSDERRRRLLRILDWANRHKRRERRHTVVHGAWWCLCRGWGPRESLAAQ
jgi:hypothetical protein